MVGRLPAGGTTGRQASRALVPVPASLGGNAVAQLGQLSCWVPKPVSWARASQSKHF